MQEEDQGVTSRIEQPALILISWVCAHAGMIFVLGGMGDGLVHWSMGVHRRAVANITRWLGSVGVDPDGLSD